MTSFPVLSSVNFVEGASLLVSAFARVTFLPKMHCSLLFAHLPASHLLQQVLGIFPSPRPYPPHSSLNQSTLKALTSSELHVPTLLVF